MLTTERYPQSNNDWEDQSEDQKICTDWKSIYKKVHTKVCVKAQAAEEADKFGAANAADWVLKNSYLTTDDGRDEVVLKVIEG